MPYESDSQVLSREIAVSLPDEQIAAFCQKWGISRLELFGSALRDDFGPNSDVDLLVTFSPQKHPTLFDRLEMQSELETIFQRAVDLVERRAVEESSNYIRRKHILQTARVIYGS